MMQDAKLASDHQNYRRKFCEFVNTLYFVSFINFALYESISTQSYN
jgi:hypothetical protein